MPEWVTGVAAALPVVWEGIGQRPQARDWRLPLIAWRKAGGYRSVYLRVVIDVTLSEDWYGVLI